MFNEKTLKDMETIDSLVSEKTRELFKNDSKLFLSWTFPTNHLHQLQAISENYFIVWVGETGKGVLKMVCCCRIGMIPKFLSDISEIELQNILDEPFVGRG
jgi:hypothetical protein